MNYLHVIITRFNLKSETFRTDKNDKSTLTDEWYQERFSLFEDICLPSLLNQTDPSFVWLLFFDVDTPEKYRSRVESYNRTSPEVCVVYCDGMGALRDSIRREIDSRLAPDTQLLVTSRIDNDDAFHEDYVARLRDVLPTIQERTVVENTRGYQLMLRDRGSFLRNRSTFYGPFLALVEPAQEYLTVMAGRHGDWKRQGCQYREISDQRLWLQTVHSSNVLNAQKRTDHVAPALAAKPFNLQLQDRIQDLDFGARVLDFVVVVVSRLGVWLGDLWFFRKIRKVTTAWFGKKS